MVTSALPGEGKTFTAVNLAMSIAMELDSTVLLVDGDVAHPALSGAARLARGPGLLDLLTDDEIDVSDALLRTNVEKLAILPAGAQHRRATELLASEQHGAAPATNWPRAIRTGSSSSTRRRCCRPPRRACSRRTWARS